MSNRHSYLNMFLRLHEGSMINYYNKFSFPDNVSPSHMKSNHIAYLYTKREEHASYGYG